MKDLNIIINHFNMYPLLTEKGVDFELFKRIFDIVSSKEHLTVEGLQKIVNLKASMNFENIPAKLKTSFPNIIPVVRPVLNHTLIYAPQWVSGFVDGEGCFTINIYKRNDTVLGEGVKLVFKVTQDDRNKALLANLVKRLGCGSLYSQSKKGHVTDFMVTGLSDIINKILPFFLAHPLEGAKRKDLSDFMRVAELMKLKAHLTKEGLKKIKAIKDNMNRKRSDN